MCDSQNCIEKTDIHMEILNQTNHKENNPLSLFAFC